ncbi:TRAP transporter small permease subunit [Cytobacillus purgationiresistens]|uniref:TRAP-type C4-dicarboxylate transport system permease small subunit n=1 Tax=Cytobacillus purgationiresistens TaxID=863449 RepID=A0ABU0ARP8_9BACI|nr:TRAP transporter small permease [Cytobacillus purgationiresistens]MDQ0273441.1 TRAP-type C4-dicarboxylate transport system permease small subunit [Cytobacillus purgationiresistens]
MQKFKAGFEFVERIIFNIGSVVLGVMMIWIFLDVLFRTIFNQPIPGTVELTGEYLMVLIVYLGLSYTLRQDGHVKVVFLYDKFSEKWKMRSDFITSLLATISFLFISVLNFNEFLVYLQYDIKSVGILGYPLAPALLLISLGSLILSIRLFINMTVIVTERKAPIQSSISESETM